MKEHGELVGDKYVYEYVEHATTGDGILTSLKMMKVMLAKKKTLSEQAALFKIYQQILKNVRVTDKSGAG